MWRERVVELEPLGTVTDGPNVFFAESGFTYPSETVPAVCCRDSIPRLKQPIDTLVEQRLRRG